MPSEEGQIARIQDAINEANKWAELAEPILREAINLDEMQSKLSSVRYRYVEENRKAGRYAYGGDAQPFEEALQPIMKTHTQLLQILDGMRDNALCDVHFATPNEASDEDSNRIDAENDEVASKVISVDAAIAAMIETMNAEGAAR